MTPPGVYVEGYWIGYDIGAENISEYAYEDYHVYLEDMLTHESEVYRQYSPFEFLAKAINESVNPEYLWNKYGDGVLAGIQAAWEEHWEGRDETQA